VITKRIVDDFKNSRYKEVRLIYTDYETISSSRVEDIKLFPFVNEENNLTDELEYTFEPNIYAVYEYTVRVLVQNILLGSVSRARAAEHAARMVAMKNATDNASELIGDLKIFYNKARQASITQEIAEISSGAAAFD
jgi:F-type H+-transporting ATPase subunit gamma